MNPKQTRIALVGIGDIARKVYLPLLSRHSGVEVAGVLSHSSSTVEETVAAYRLPRGTTRLEELLSWKPDAVFVHSPTSTHYEIVMQCLRSGVAVYVDKPLSGEWEQSQRMAELAEDRGLLLGVGFNRRFAPMVTAARDWLAEAGDFSQVSAIKHRTRVQQGSSSETVHDDLIHILDLLLWLGGADAELLQDHLVSDSQGRLLQATGMLGWSNGAAGLYSMVRDAGADLEKLELHGGGRSAEVTDLEKLVLYEAGSPACLHSFGSWDTILERRGFSGVVDEFLNHLDTPQQCGISASQVLPVHKLAARLTH
ncbi:Gfo/Idh/MocA family protein [Paenibacillus donghaensis]|uniref:Dehydrogenase n=1 Tax=Paenibacillus donghaensis TaxID=414771 RepID=A0A2Z2KU47_9BACL|nr:Gfo/Idh/MocA family oxidoreductase [Paenibacillus donghaensis]ASA23188.1 dehydrogenase [Paenibacillus donghaensis]